jgi:hypothetical protein
MIPRQNCDLLIAFFYNIKQQIVKGTHEKMTSFALTANNKSNLFSHYDAVINV